MKKFFYKISSFLIALVVLLSTTSFTINEHFCGDELMDLSFFGSAKSCGMEVKETSKLPNCSIDKEGCCTDEQISIQGQDQLQLSFEKLTLEQQVFIASFLYTYINLFEGLDNKVSSHEEYRPPLVIRQIYKIDETYLI